MLVRTETLERLRTSVNGTIPDWSAMLEIPSRTYTREMKAIEVEISEPVLERLAQILEILPEAVLSGNVDYRLLAKRASGHAIALPEKYTQAAYSKVRTSAYILDYVEMIYGWRARDGVLRHFQMNESIISEPNMPISVRFLADLCDHLESNGFAWSGFREIGKYSSITNSKGPLAELFRQERSPSATYERGFSDLIGKYYDQNNVYTLRSIGPYHCSVEARPHPQLLDESDGKFFSTASICAAKAGVFASIMGYLGLPDATVAEVECVHRGDTRCRFEIDFENAVWTFRRRNSPPTEQ